MNTIANTIYQQLGGGRFTAMTGAKNFIALENGLRFNIPTNASKANKVTVTLDADDTYTVTFTRYTPYSFKITKNGFKETPEKIVVIKELDGIYCDMLQDTFTAVTGMYTRLF